MKILIHTDEYYPTAQACSYRMRVIADTLIDQGNEVVVVCSSTNQGNGKKEVRREKIVYSPAFRMKKKTAAARLINNLSFGVSSIFSSLKVGEVDIVITTSPPPLVSIPGWMIAKLKKAKLVYDVRDIWPDVALEMGSFSEGSFFCKVFRNIALFMYKHADMITTVSPGKVEKIQEYVRSARGKKSGPLNVSKVRLIGNGFDESVQNHPINHELIRRYGLDHTFTCVYVGNIGLAQGLEALLKLAAETKHKEVQFLLFGTGAEKKMLEAKAKEMGLDQVKFCGVLPHEDVYTLLSSAKLSFISLKNSNMKDSIPTKVYEALGIGCPVLLIAEGDSCRIIEEAKLGRHLSPDCIEQLPEVFDEMINHYDQIILHKEEARRLMHDQYSRQQIAIEFAKQLRAL